MGFKLIKETPQQKKYCDYIENKFTVARQYNTVYELSDEDLRIQKLYDDNRLQPKDVIRTISRIQSQEDGQQYITVSKNVDFINKITKTYHDRYSDTEGVTEIPVTITNEEGVEESSQLQLVYTIPFSKQKARELIKKGGSKAKLRFYIGPVTANRAPIDPIIIGNKELFVEGTWEELLLAKEKKFVSSGVNRLEEIRKEINTSTTTHEELNKEEKSNNVISEEDDGKIKVKNPNTSSKNN